MNNIMKIVDRGMCTGCSACDICEHIQFKKNDLGFFAPVVDDQCTKCGNCLKECIHDPDRDDD